MALEQSASDHELLDLIGSLPEDEHGGVSV
jgi:hypothetical protein